MNAAATHAAATNAAPPPSKCPGCSSPMWFQKRRVALAASPPPRRLGEGGGSGSGFLVPTDPTGAIPDPEEIKRAICRALYGHIDEGDDPHVVHYHPESGAHFVQTYPLPIRGQLTGQSGSAQL